MRKLFQKLFRWLFTDHRQAKLNKDRDRRIRRRMFHFNSQDRSRQFGYFGKRRR